MDKRAIINHLDPRAGLWLLLMANIGMVLSEKYRAGEYAFGHISPASVGVWTVSGGMQGAGFTGYVSIAVAVCISMVPCMDKYGVSGSD